jgi:hypothetical protein
VSEEGFESQRLVVGNHFSWEPIPDGCLLFEESTGKLLTLNPAAEAVLAHCDGELTGAEISSVLETDFDIPATETRSLLQRLSAEGVIQPAPDA